MEANSNELTDYEDILEVICYRHSFVGFETASDETIPPQSKQMLVLYDQA